MKFVLGIGKSWRTYLPDEPNPPPNAVLLRGRVKRTLERNHQIFISYKQREGKEIVKSRKLKTVRMSH